MQIKIQPIITIIFIRYKEDIPFCCIASYQVSNIRNDTMMTTFGDITGFNDTTQNSSRLIKTDLFSIHKKEIDEEWTRSTEKRDEIPLCKIWKR